jgi:hypothetical protein
LVPIARRWRYFPVAFLRLLRRTARLPAFVHAKLEANYRTGALRKQGACDFCSQVELLTYCFTNKKFRLALLLQ